MFKKGFLSILCFALIFSSFVFTGSNNTASAAGTYGVKSLSGSGWASYIIDTNDDLWVVGGMGASFTKGELGAGATASSQTVIRVKGINGVGFLEDVKQVSSNGNFTVALLLDGSVVSWGSNATGALGVGQAPGALASSNYPRRVVGIGGTGNLTGVTKVEAGVGSAMALRSDGSVVVWGEGTGGQMGDGGTTAINHTPKAVTTMSSEVTDISIGGFSNSMDTMYAVKGASGEAWSWGATGFGGTLGTGAQETLSPANKNYALTPVRMKALDGTSNLVGISKIFGGNFNPLLLSTTGTIYSWGSRVGSNQDNMFASEVPGLEGAPSLTAVEDVYGTGAAFVLKYTDDSYAIVGSLYMNTQPTAGTGMNVDASNTRKIMGPSGIGTLDSTITKVHALGGDSFAFETSDSTDILVLGVDRGGRLGYGTTISHTLYPVVSAELNNINDPKAAAHSAGNAEYVSNTLVVNTLSEDTVVRLYSTISGGPAASQTQTVGTGETSVVFTGLTYAQAGGSYFISVQPPLYNESDRTAIAYGASPSAPLVLSNVKVLNNNGSSDVILINNLVSGDIITVYSDVTALDEITNATVGVGQTSLTITLPSDLGSAAGSVYITRTSSDIGASEIAAIPYTSDTDTLAPYETHIRTLNNPTPSTDTATVSFLQAGDVVNVYDAPTGGVLLGTGTVPISRTSVTVNITPELTSLAGSIYVTVTSVGKSESVRTQSHFLAESDTLQEIQVASFELFSSGEFTFEATVLDFTDTEIALRETEKPTAALVLSVADSRSTNDGWAVTLDITDFVSTDIIDPTNLSGTVNVAIDKSYVNFQSGEITVTSGQAIDQNNGPFTYSGSLYSTRTLFAASNGYGAGEYSVPLTFTVDVPSTVRVENIVGDSSSYTVGQYVGVLAGTYVSTFRFTGSTGI